MLRDQPRRQIEIEVSERKFGIDLHGFTGHEVVPGEGIEPTLCCQNRILSPARLPVPPARPNWDADYRLFVGPKFRGYRSARRSELCSCEYHQRFAPRNLLGGRLTQITPPPHRQVVDFPARSRELALAVLLDT